jgi:hypothetical protein
MRAASRKNVSKRALHVFTGRIANTVYLAALRRPIRVPLMVRFTPVNAAGRSKIP